MRRSLLALLSAAIVLFYTAGVRAADDDCKAIIAKAVKAHGGEEKLLKFKATQAKGKGKADTPFGELEFRVETATMYPDKTKEVTELEVMGQKVKVVTLINGDKITIEANGMEAPVPDGVKDSLKDTAHQAKIGKLVPLLKDKEFKLSSIGEVKVNDKPAVGILIKAEGHKDVSLFFDKDTSLLVKVEKRSIDPMTNKEVTEERIITEYQKIDGMQAPKKVTVLKDGKKSVELELEEVKFLEKLDESEFKK